MSGEEGKWWLHPVALGVGGTVLVAGVLLVAEWRYHIGDAWVGIVGALGGTALGAVVERVKWRGDERVRTRERGEDTAEARAQWVRQLRFSAYEELMAAMLQLGRMLKELADQKALSEKDAERLSDASVDWVTSSSKVKLYGSEAAREAISLQPLLPRPAVGQLDPLECEDCRKASNEFITLRVALGAAVAQEVDGLLEGDGARPSA